MRIAVFTQGFPVVSETFILHQLTGLLDRGHEIDIYAETPGDGDVVHHPVARYRLVDRTCYRPPLSRRVASRLLGTARLAVTEGRRAPAVTIRSLDPFTLGRAALTGRLLHQASPLIRRGCPRYDVIHAHFAATGLKAVQLRRIGAIAGPVLTTFHGVDVNVGKPAVLRRRFRALCEEGNLFTANTYFTADRAAAMGCPRDRIVKLPVGVRLGPDQFRPRTLDPGEAVTILTVARLVEKKGLEYGIRAVARLKAAHSSVRYRIAGDGELRPRLQSLIRELDLESEVTLLGSRTMAQVAELYRSSHLFLLPSVTAGDGDMEGQGLVLQEAQAAGLPVVSTRHNGIPEGVRDGETGFLVPERDPAALAERLSYLVEHPEVWPAMGRAGRALVEAEFDIEILNDRLVDIYHSLQQPGTRSSSV
jgi:colanic acid/amylovoran biosynthesis glycosyltransferase